MDNENKKNGNIQHLRDHGIEPDEAEECFFHHSILPLMSAGSMMFTSLTEGQIAAKD